MSETRFSEVNGIVFHFTVGGRQAGRPMVFLNTLGGDLRIWDKLVPYFAADYRLVRYDKRGHGLSDCPPGPYTIRDHSRDLVQLLDSLQMDQAILVGNSVGGMIALDLAAANPNKVAALILCDTAAKIGTAGFWNERIESIQAKGMEQMARAILPRWFAEGYSSAHPADYRGYYNMLARTPVSGYIATCKAIRDADLSGITGNIGASSLVLCGAEDAATPPDLVRGLAESLPESQFELIDGAGHTPGVERPEVMAAKMNQFLETIGYV